MYYAYNYILQFDVECYRDDLQGNDDLGMAEVILGYRVGTIQTCVEDARAAALKEIVSEYNDMCDPYDEDSPVPLLLEDLVVDHEVTSGINRVKRGDEIVAYISMYEVKVVQ